MVKLGQEYAHMIAKQWDFGNFAGRPFVSGVARLDGSGEHPYIK